MAQRILIIEDEEAIATAVGDRLRSEGFDVDIALDGPTGVARCAELEPDLVILDVMLPGFDGIEVCRRSNASVANWWPTHHTNSALPSPPYS